MPHIGVRAIARHRVLLQLQRGRDRRVTFVIAPGGYGKTYLMAQWLTQLKSENREVAWLTLEPEDKDPDRLVAGLLVVIDAVAPGKAQAHDFGSLNSQQLIGVLLKRLSALRKPLHLFIDDYHVAQSDAIDAVFAKLLKSPESASLRLAIGSRREPRFPISSLQLSGEFLRLTKSDLRFSEAEVQTMFGHAAIKLTREQIEHLTSRTEGWAVALQMVRLLIVDGAPAEKTLGKFGGSQSEMARYLSEQVTNALPPEVRDFLFQTCALPQVSADLAAAIMGCADAANIYFALDDYALPLSADEDVRWIRYHPVFRDYLLDAADRGGFDGKAALRSAASWFAKQGDWESAVRHAILAEDIRLAAILLEAAGGWRTIYVGSRGLSPLLRQLVGVAPEAEWRQFPRTFLGLSIVCAKLGQLDLAANFLEMFEGPFDAPLEREIRVISALIALYRDKPLDRAELAMLRNDLDHVAEGDPVLRALQYNLLSFQSLLRTALVDAQHFGLCAIRSFHTAGAQFGAMHLHIHVGQACFFIGDIAGAASSYGRLIEDAQAHIGRGSDLDAMGQVLQGELRAELGQRDVATPMFQEALAHLEDHDCWFDLLAAGYLTLVRQLALDGDVAAADAMLDRASVIARRRSFERLESLVNFERIRLMTIHGGLNEAMHLAERNGGDIGFARDAEENDVSRHLRGEVPVTLSIRLWQRAGELDKAREALGWLRRHAHRPLSVTREIHLGVLETRQCLAEDNAEDALLKLTGLVLTLPSLEYRSSFTAEGPEFVSFMRSGANSAATSGLVRRRLLTLLDHDEPGAATSGKATFAGGGDLTAREQSILRLVTGGYSNKEIGRRLELSDNTVKFHLRNVFQKLQVHSRTGAVSAARELGITV